MATGMTGHPAVIIEPNCALPEQASEVLILRLDLPLSVVSGGHAMVTLCNRINTLCYRMLLGVTVSQRCRRDADIR